MNEFVDRKVKIGLFDSGIGGFSILSQLLSLLPNEEYFYFSDDANAPYGPKSDDFITDRSIKITEELIKQKVDLIVVACNTATASSIDTLRVKFPLMTFVGVEPYLNAYYKMPEGEKKMAVLTTVSTGKSERFKRLKERLDPEGKIVHIALANLARLIEDFYFQRMNEDQFVKEVSLELKNVGTNNFTHVILGCTHYPLIANIIQKETGAIPVSPDHYIAVRVADLLKLSMNSDNEEIKINKNKSFHFYSSSNNQWKLRNQSDLFLPFKK